MYAYLIIVTYATSVYVGVKFFKWEEFFPYWIYCIIGCYGVIYGYCIIVLLAVIVLAKLVVVNAGENAAAWLATLV